jgi:hypothetical protein
MCKGTGINDTQLQHKINSGKMQQYNGPQDVTVGLLILRIRNHANGRRNARKIDNMLILVDGFISSVASGLYY